MIDAVAEKALAACQSKGWKRGWVEGGCYLHLEASEFVEALRGKGDSSPEEEAADVLFVLLSMLAHRGTKPSDVLAILDKKCDEILGSTEWPRAPAP